MIQKLKEFEWSSLDLPIEPDREMLVYNAEYYEFLRFANGARISNSYCIGFQIGNDIRTEELLDFMSFEQIKENDYLLGYLPHFIGEEFEKFERIMKTYKVFCSTYEPNTFFAFSTVRSDNQAVFYLDFDEY